MSKRTYQFHRKGSSLILTTRCAFPWLFIPLTVIQILLWCGVFVFFLAALLSSPESKFHPPLYGKIFIIIWLGIWIWFTLSGGRESGLKKLLFEAYSTLTVVANETGLSITQSIWGTQTVEQFNWDQIVAFSRTTQDDAFVSDLILYTTEKNIVLDTRLNAKDAEIINTRLSRFHKNSTES